MISDPVAVLCVLAAVVFISVRLEEHFNFFRSLGAVLVGILFSMLLSNLGIIPGTSPTYEFLVGSGVIVGLLGYAICNYFGYAIAILMRGLLI